MQTSDTKIDNFMTRRNQFADHVIRVAGMWCPPVIRTVIRRLFDLSNESASIVENNQTKEEEELARLVSISRRIESTATLRDVKYVMTDAPSFAHMYKSYFIEESYKFFSENANPYIVDCGANVGVGVRYWKALFPTSRVVAIEPDPQCFECLEANTRDLVDVELVRKAAWSTNTLLKFAAVGADGGHLSSLADRNGVVKTLDVESVRLRDYLIGEVDLLKIDIEGAEMEVLRDCKDHLGLVRNLFVEYHSFVGADQELSNLFGIIESAGFRTYSSVEYPAKQPFIHRPVSNCKDFRINIWCFRD